MPPPTHPSLNTSTTTTSPLTCIFSTMNRLLSLLDNRQMRALLVTQFTLSKEVSVTSVYAYMMLFDTKWSLACRLQNPQCRWIRHNGFSIQTYFETSVCNGRSFWFHLVFQRRKHLRLTPDLIFSWAHSWLIRKSFAHTYLLIHTDDRQIQKLSEHWT